MPKPSVQNVVLLEELRKASLGLFVAFLAMFLWGLHEAGGWLLDSHRFVLGRDFLNFWMAGKLALDDPTHLAAYYDPAHYMQALRAITLPDYWDNQLSYPPTQFLFALPFGLLPYGLAYALWLGATLFVFWWYLRQQLDSQRVLLVLLCPASLAMVLCGQSSWLTASLILLAFTSLDRRPWWAGCCIGLLMLKPQLGLLFPIFLLVTWRWRVFLAAALTVLALVGTSIFLWGVEPWQAYLLRGIAEQSEVLIHTSDMVNALTPTFFNDLLVSGVDPQLGLMLQGGMALLAALAVAVVSRRLPADSAPLFVMAMAVLATCYLQSYDLLAFSALLVIYAAKHPLTRNGQLLFAACFAMPFIDFATSMIPLPGVSLLPAVLGFYLWNQARAAS